MNMKELITLMYVLRKRTQFCITRKNRTEIFTLNPDVTPGESYDLTMLNSYVGLTIEFIDISDSCIRVSAIENEPENEE